MFDRASETLHWELEYAVGSATFSVRVNGVSAGPFASFTAGQVNTGEIFNGAFDPAGSIFVDAVPAAVAVPGDYNDDGNVADYVVWRKTDGTQTGYDTWRANFGEPAVDGSGAAANTTVPEPATLVLLMFAVARWSFRQAWLHLSTKNSLTSETGQLTTVKKRLACDDTAGSRDRHRCFRAASQNPSLR